ncbi:RNA-directed DNA methylation 4-like isoform X3 [Nicotiana tabacum]|uniref:RNA-directed DNA methylation 4-like isoform X3 n=1 Tax=Nicotiana tabacum TaxID=4097 RepID=A0A1S4DFX3_TOBAC|nr:RNA-directed DNA methylation 4 isoform X3 [Nicotiana tomentosiformis]XP_016512236.1 PREDICTED: RNA-directed DNA methylation 4-like isoform X3 [Nicotiana tabacum]
MAAVAESSSAPSKEDKPVIVRVKRKTFQSRLDAFWLEINERPLKRPLLDFEKLSISDSSSRVEELKSRKVLVRHVETVTSSEVTVDILKSFAQSAPADASEVKEKAEIRRSFRAENKQDQLLAKAKQKQEDLSKNARFEQIWKSRKEKKKLMHDEELNEMCRLYDVIRVDTEETKHEVQEGTTELEDHRMMSQYLPLLREVMPSAAEEIESEIHNYKAKQDGYVYDYYAVKGDTNTGEDIASPFPLVQVDDDDDYCDGPDYSDNESDDSNAEHNPWNDYPDEEESEDEDEDEDETQSSEVLSSTSQDQYGSETVGVISFQNEDVGREDWSDYADPLVDGESDSEAYDDDDEDIW